MYGEKFSNICDTQISLKLPNVYEKTKNEKKNDKVM